MREPILAMPRNAVVPETPYPCIRYRRAAAQIFAASLFLSFCLFSASSAKAQPIPRKCLNGQATATRVLDAGRLAVEGVTSNNDYSETPGCGFYVMEIAVPASSTPPPGFTPSFSLQTGPADIDAIMSNVVYLPPNPPNPSRDRCSSYRQQTWVAKKSVANSQMTGPGGFKRIASWQTIGVWIPAKNSLPTHCELRAVGGQQSGDFAPPKSGTDFYRIGVQVRTGYDNFLYKELHFWNVRIRASRGEDIR